MSSINFQNLFKFDSVSDEVSFGNASNPMSITSEGPGSFPDGIAIGTIDTPSTGLHLQFDGSDAQIRLDNTHVGGRDWGVYSSSNANSVGGGKFVVTDYSASGDGTRFVIDGSGNARFHNNLTVSGNLTINGTTTTLNTATLDVEDLNITVASGASNAAAADGAGLTVDGADASLIYKATPNAWSFNKKVGVGTSDPAYRLTVQETNDHAYVGITSHNTKNASLLLGDPDNKSIGRVTYYNATNAMGLRTNGADRITIESGGDVGIGTGSPSSRLHVAGNVTCSNQIRATGWFTGPQTTDGAAWNNIPFGTAGSNSLGRALEIGVSSDIGYVMSYDRSAGEYGRLRLQAQNAVLFLDSTDGKVKSSTNGGNNFYEVLNTNNVATNSKNTDGFVSAPGNVANKVWKTDGSGNPAWRDDAAGTTSANYYLDGITKNGNTLTFSVNGAANKTFTFGSNAFNSTTIPTNNNQLTNGKGYTTNTGTVTSVVAGSGLAGGTITDSGTLTHADTSTQASVNNSGNTFIQDISVDTYGHITSITSATASVGGSGDITGVNITAGTGLTGSLETLTGTHTQTLNVDFSETSLAIGTTTGNGTNAILMVHGKNGDGQSIIADGDVVAMNNASDDRLKTNTNKIDNALDKVASLEGFSFDWNDAAKEVGITGEEQVGLSAQSLEKVLPQVVKGLPNSDYKMVDYQKVVPLLVEAIKELKSEIEELKGKQDPYKY
ncbi:MAG: hypothetical protein CMO74_14200 [Verrucomicrobiales bacterium]|nr:hypothetical protein [Verrucomicrobiales bacterium]|tara:strand:+ start:24734 stop:26902 length:2169 start_codon:yes stop_codon:yes gene_type:complete